MIEVVCILAILSLVAAIVWPVWPAATSRPRLEHVALEMASLLKADRAAAIRGQTGVSTLIGDRALLSGNSARRVGFPSDVVLRFSADGLCRSSNAVRFDAAGQTCGRRLRLEGPSDRLDLVFNDVTGGIEIVASP